MSKKLEFPALVSRLVALDSERAIIEKETADIELERKQLMEKAALLEKKTESLKLREAEIDAALSEAAKKAKLSIPKVVREVVLMMLRGCENFKPEKLSVVKPTDKDPLVIYNRQTILWYLEI